MTDAQWDFDALDSAEAFTREDTLASPQMANARVAQLMADSVGAAPTIEPPEDDFVDLPGGLYWDGQLLKSARVRELTGDDEEALAAIRGSIARWLSVLLERAVVQIGYETPTPKMLSKLLIGDRDALLLGVRIATFGRDVTVRNVQCPHCEKHFDATVDLTTLDRVELKEPTPRHEYEVPLRRGGMAVIRLPDGVAQEAMFADEDVTLAVRNTTLLSHVLVNTGEAGTKSGAEMARSLGMADRQVILQFIAENQPGPKLDDIRFTHEACGEEVRLELTLPEIFRI